MALQVCSRCRKRKIKCDLQLPTCKNCRIADVECLFWDDSLGREISCSYLHSLQQKVASLQLEIKDATTSTASTGNHVPPTHDLHEVAPPEVVLQQQGHYLNIYDDHLPTSRTVFLGPATSARLLERVLKSMVKWHAENGMQISKRLVPDDGPAQATGPQNFTSSGPSFPINNALNEQRKLEPHSIMPPSTQRSIIEHYLAIVSPEYPLLPLDQESTLLSHENPLKWSSTNGEEANALALTIVFAVSTALVSRDIDPNLTSISTRCRQDVYKIHQEYKHLSSDDPIKTERWVCVALCASALCELIYPLSGDAWELLGRATSTLQRLREGYQLKSMELDEPFIRLERSLLKLESSIALHLDRPSYLNDMRLQEVCGDSSSSDILHDELQTLRILRTIHRELQLSPAQPASYFENMIPLPMQVHSIESDISIHSARLYISLHPLFTSSGIYLTSTPSQLFQIIAYSASTMIDHFTRLNAEHRIISVYLAAESILEAGIVWSVYLMSQHLSPSAGIFHRDSINMSARTAMGPVLKVSSLLASFSVRWPPVSAYAEAWETLVDMLWIMI
ncbi:hypothetical protein BGW36DRAFT_411575 [Talaromyces proteolyticus]|uniref:Zn(2)-C6 fungal-type domain-containing protein n=1 Tax=Talaromyces proteolyticus TaxID=1131652 RepID=A0AAD4KGU1_9EURO|nr:uncharacterized protein BGW36DRAFT_411575 [Talaromyces proteolyticus]KAH8690800.1 hypothetical protein BGW36DRAFT_411575 [Talaromyces proteolyticus]